MRRHASLRLPVATPFEGIRRRNTGTLLSPSDASGLPFLHVNVIHSLHEEEQLSLTF